MLEKVSEVVKKIDPTVKLILSVVGLILAIPKILQLWRRLQNNWKKPKIMSGFWDSPNSNRSDFYIRVTRPVVNVKFLLNLSSFSPADFEVKVTTFFQNIGYEHMQEFKFFSKDFKNSKEVEFDLPNAGLYRLSLISQVGYVGLPVMQYVKEFDIACPGAKICHKRSRVFALLLRLAWRIIKI